jgi:hypothetical protein
MMRRAVAALALTVLVVVAPAQDRSPKSGQPDPQSTLEPPSGPGVGQAFLAKFVGDWDVAKTFRCRSGEAARSTGECKQAMIHDGARPEPLRR